MGNNCSFCDGNDIINQKNIESNCFVNRGFKRSRFENFVSMDNQGSVYDGFSPRNSDGGSIHHKLVG